MTVEKKRDEKIENTINDLVTIVEIFIKMLHLPLDDQVALLYRVCNRLQEIRQRTKDEAEKLRSGLTENGEVEA
jgi:hypothetical protein